MNFVKKLKLKKLLIFDEMLKIKDYFSYNSNF